MVYHPGKSNIVDPLSRLCSNKNSAKPLPEQIKQVVEYSCPVAVKISEIKKLSENGEDVRKVKDGIQNFPTGALLT